MTDPDVPAGEGTTTPSLRERKRVATRQAILDACALIDLAYGGALHPEVFTFARVAEVAGVSERTVYRTFPNKAELDRAYVAEQVILAGVTPPDDLDGWGDVMREVMRIWSRRLGDERIEPQERELEGFPASKEDRRRRDEELLERVGALFPEGSGVGERQRVAMSAAIHATISIRSVAITAQRWGLTLEEAGMAHAWVFDTVLAALRDAPVTPWEGDR